MKEVKEHIKRHIISSGYTQAEADTVTLEQGPDKSVIHFSFGIGTKRFIRKVLIEELKLVIDASPYLSFVTMASGIEFLGKCIDEEYPTDWDKSGRSSLNFNAAIRNLNGLNRYIFLLDRKNIDLYSSFRCGLAHGLAPKKGISLSHGRHEAPNLSEVAGVVNLNINNLFDDFILACEDVISRSYSEPNKMNEARMYVRGTCNAPTVQTFVKL